DRPAELPAGEVVDAEVAGRGECGVARPAELFAAANHAGEFVDRAGDELVVDEDDVCELADVGSGQAVAVADVCDEGDAEVGPGGQGPGEVIADERDAGPGGVTSLGDEQDAETRIGHAESAQQEAGGSWLYTARPDRPYIPSGLPPGFRSFSSFSKRLSCSRSWSTSPCKSRSAGGIEESSASALTLTSGSNPAH